MNKEMMGRLKTAGEYQKKAIRALFPEEMEDHLTLIEKEMKAMFMEMAMAAFMEAKANSPEEDKTEKTEMKKTKKVDID